MHLRVLPALALAAATAGCGFASPSTDDRSFGAALIGEWQSPGCSRAGSDCTIWTFGSDGQFTYDFETDDYEDSHSTRWSVEQIAEGVGRVSLEGAGVHFAVIDDQGLTIQDEGTAYTKIGSGGGSAPDLDPVDPGPLGHAMVGTWLQQSGVDSDNDGHPERITLDASGEFAATYGDVACSGVWTFGVRGDFGRNAGGPDEGSLRLNSGDLCENTENYQDRQTWARVDRFSVTASEDLLVLDGVRYHPSS